MICQMNRPTKVPLSIGSLTKDEFDAEMKRGYDDCVSERTFPVEEVFRELETELGL